VPARRLSSIVLPAGLAALLLAPAAAASRIALGWNEVAPLCNRVSNVGVSGCAGARYPAAFRLRVATLSVQSNTWSVGVSLTNLTRKPLTFTGGPIRLCLFPSAKSPRARCLPTPAVPRPLVRLSPGRTWRLTQQGTGRIRAGQWIRFRFPTVQGSFTSPTGNVIAWTTVHAYRFGPGGHSVASAIGTG
jgi:hypothetical protein